MPAAAAVQVNVVPAVVDDSLDGICVDIFLGFFLRLLNHQLVGILKEFNRQSSI
jgi:hypothetical protein